VGTAAARSQGAGRVVGRPPDLSVRTLRILHVPDCPTVDLLVQRLGIALRDRPDTVMTRQIIDTVEAATTEGMNGSPTLLVDGVDPFAEPGQQPSLSCRLHREDGRPGGVPSVRALRCAVGRAQGPMLTSGRER
jgi:hypothetical protein